MNERLPSVVMRQVEARRARVERSAPRAVARPYRKAGTPSPKPSAKPAAAAPAPAPQPAASPAVVQQVEAKRPRSEEHTSELQSLMRISYAVFCLKKKKSNKYIEQRS